MWPRKDFPRPGCTGVPAYDRPVDAGQGSQRVTGFLDALGKKLAEHWLSLLVLPGALWVATALVTVRLGRRHTLDPRVLIDAAEQWAKRPHSPAMIALVLAGVLLASTGAGLTATWLGTVVRRLWVVRGQWWPARWLTRWRQRRWRAADREAEELVAEAIRTAPTESEVVLSGPAVAEALARRDAI